MSEVWVPHIYLRDREKPFCVRFSRMLRWLLFLTLRNSQGDARSSFYSETLRDLLVQELGGCVSVSRLYRAHKRYRSAACQIFSGISQITLALLWRSHGQNPATLTYLVSMLCQTHAAFSASLMLIHECPAQAYPGLPRGHLGSCTLSSRFPDNANKLDSSTTCKVPRKNVHANAVLLARSAGRSLLWLYPSRSPVGWGDNWWRGPSKHYCNWTVLNLRFQRLRHSPFYLKQSRDWTHLVFPCLLLVHLSLQLQSSTLQGSPASCTPLPLPAGSPPVPSTQSHPASRPTTRKVSGVWWSPLIHSWEEQDWGGGSTSFCGTAFSGLHKAFWTSPRITSCEVFRWVTKLLISPSGA